MPKVKLRSYRSTVKQDKKRVSYEPSVIHLLLAVALGLVLIICFASATMSSFLTNFDHKAAIEDSTYSLVRQPTISVDFINNILDHYHSPAKDKGQILYNEGVKYGIDPAYALAFFMQESDFGTKGVATITHSLGNIRATNGHPQYNGYRLYYTWEEGFEDWYQLIANKYIKEWNLTTVDQIIPVYAPNSDHNDEQQYIQSIKYIVTRWRAGYVDISA